MIDKFVFCDIILKKLCLEKRKGKIMKANIHPEMKEATVKCACGETFNVLSTKDSISVEVCSKCHPYYTGTQARAKKTGNVEKFNRKYGIKDQKAE